MDNVNKIYKLFIMFRKEMSKCLRMYFSIHVCVCSEFRLYLFFCKDKFYLSFFFPELENTETKMKSIFMLHRDRDG